MNRAVASIRGKDSQRDVLPEYSPKGALLKGSSASLGLGPRPWVKRSLILLGKGPRIVKQRGNKGREPKIIPKRRAF